jgi:predicted nucleic acid-binding protein
VIVVDASALLDALLASTRAATVLDSIAASDETVHAPHLIDLEVVSGLRRLARTRQLGHEDAEQCLTTLRRIRLHRHAHEPLVPRIWELRPAVSAYDAAYLALAEALECPLLTSDARLARTSGHSVDIRLLA